MVVLRWVQNRKAEVKENSLVIAGRGRITKRAGFGRLQVGCQIHQQKMP